MSYVSGSTKYFLSLLEDAFRCGYSAGYFHLGANESWQDAWEEFRRMYLHELEDES
jgi:predicted methyltransferase